MAEDRKSSILDLMLSAGLSGAVLGAGAKALSPALRGMGKLDAAKKLAGAAGLGATLGGGLAGGSGAVGSLLMPQEEGQPSHWTQSAGVGGLIAGGLAGGGLGALAGAGKLRGALAAVGSKTPVPLRKIARAMGTEAPTDNALVDFITKKRNPIAGGLIGGGIGAGLGGTIGALQGADEGLQADFIDRQIRAARQEEEIKRMMGGMYG